MSNPQLYSPNRPWTSDELTQLHKHIVRERPRWRLVANKLEADVLRYELKEYPDCQFSVGRYAAPLDTILGVLDKVEANAKGQAVAATGMRVQR